MSRIPAIEPAAAEPKAKPLLDAVQQAFGVVPNLFRVAAHAPAALEGLLGLNTALGHGRLNAKTREAISLAIAETNGCDYCLSAHSAIGHRVGLTDSDIAAARTAGAADPRTAAILRFARLLVEHRGQASDAELAALRAAGVGDAEIVEIVANTVLNIFTNTLNLVAHTDIDFPVVRAATAAAPH